MAGAQIKGIGLVGIVKALRTRRDEIGHLVPAELRHYLDERIVVAGWYPEQDYLTLLRVYVRNWPQRSYEEVGRFGAKEVLHSVYRNIIVGGVESAARRMNVNWRNYHDTGELSVETPPGTIRVRVCDYDIQARELCQLNTGYFGELLRLSGAEITAQRKPHCTCSGDADCVWEFDWQKAALEPQ